MPTAVDKRGTDAEVAELVSAYFPEKGRVFTNTRFPELKVLSPNGRWLKFNSTKLIATNEDDAAFVSTLRGVYAEPDNFRDLDAGDPSFFVHKSTGFKTLNRHAYDDWVNHSEWSATRR